MRETFRVGTLEESFIGKPLMEPLRGVPLREPFRGPPLRRSFRGEPLGAIQARICSVSIWNLIKNKGKLVWVSPGQNLLNFLLTFNQK